MPADRLQAIAFIRQNLHKETQPVGRHDLFASLAERLYEAREQFESALAEFDEVCALHDAEMVTIRPALVATFGGLPLLEVYKQSAIRHQKAQDVERALWWARRGVEIYGNDALNPGFAADLSRRISKYEAKLAPRPTRPIPVRQQAANQGPTYEILICRTCGDSFEREQTRGRKPIQCPRCRNAAPSSA
jgi:rubrerythrin